ncbi:MAG: Mrp/NBP35 family ATP-binding protein [Bacteroidetes bacterium]|nr:Mrp/NBP35 family ATP-binding protein [Bacteroidota bacterium]
MITKEAILQALSNVDDPDLKKDIVTLGMVENLEIKDENIRFDLVLTTPACPMKDMLVNACKTAIKVMVSSSAVTTVNATSRVTTTRKSAEVLTGVKNIIAVASGKGGVGKSTVAAGLALALQKSGASVGLLDADIYGPSVPTIFNIHESPEMVVKGDKQMMIPVVKSGIKLLSIGMMTAPDQAIVWRGPMISSAFRQFVNDVEWGELDYLIIDLPPGTGDVQLTLSQIVPLTGLVIVTTPQQLAMADARRAISMFKMPAIAKHIIGIIENMAYFSPDDAPDKKYYLFGRDGGKELAREQQVPFLGELPLIPAIQQQSDNGTLDASQPGFAPFVAVAEEVARQLSVLNSQNLANFASQNV